MPTDISIYKKPFSPKYFKILSRAKNPFLKIPLSNTPTNMSLKLLHSYFTLRIPNNFFDLCRIYKIKYYYGSSFPPQRAGRDNIESDFLRSAIASINWIVGTLKPRKFHDQNKFLEPCMNL